MLFPISGIDAYRGIPSNCIVMMKYSDDTLICVNASSVDKLIQRNYAYFGAWISECNNTAEINIETCHMSLSESMDLCISSDFISSYCIIFFDIPVKHSDCKILFKLAIDYNMTNSDFDKAYMIYDYFHFSYKFCDVVAEFEDPFENIEYPLNKSGAEYLIIHHKDFVMLNGLPDTLSINYRSNENYQYILYDFIFYSDDMKYVGQVGHTFYGISHFFFL